MLIIIINLSGLLFKNLLNYLAICLGVQVRVATCVRVCDKAVVYVFYLVSGF